MAYEIIKIDGPVLHVRIKGVMQLADQQALQAAAKKTDHTGTQTTPARDRRELPGWRRGSTGVTWIF